MKRAILLRRAAQSEYVKSSMLYEKQRPGLGERFEEAVESVFDRITKMPELHPIVLRDIRKAVVSGFPYCVYYRERDGNVIVLPVFHTSRDPMIWQSRR